MLSLLLPPHLLTGILPLFISLFPYFSAPFLLSYFLHFLHLPPLSLSSFSPPVSPLPLADPSPPPPPPHPRRCFGTKCAGCAQGISPSDLVRRARSKVFHLNCFTCMMCNKQLSTGEELYIIDENKFVCKEDYLSNSSVAKENSLHSGEAPIPGWLGASGSWGSKAPAHLSLPSSQPPRAVTPVCLRIPKTRRRTTPRTRRAPTCQTRKGVATKMTTRTWAPSDGDRAPPSKPSSWRR